MTHPMTYMYVMISRREKWRVWQGREVELNSFPRIDVDSLHTNLTTMATTTRHPAREGKRKKRSGKESTNTGFLAFARSVISVLDTCGRTRTAERYTTAVNSFRRFTHGNDVELDAFDSAMMGAYETYLSALGIRPNSISFYMRALRAIYNRAVDGGVTAQRFPFRRVYTGVERTVKRAISLRDIRRIKEADLSASPMTALARDIFMFSFYTRGMSMIDIAYLRPADLHDGALTYRRHKTGQTITIRWEEAMQRIVDRYSEADSPFLLPLIKDPGGNMRRQYLTTAHRINRHLRKIGQALRLSAPLTSYVARHTWASIAKSQSIPLAVISEAMGHESEKTTRIYLASLDTSEVDEANNKLINLV